MPCGVRTVWGKLRYVPRQSVRGPPAVTNKQLRGTDETPLAPGWCAKRPVILQVPWVIAIDAAKSVGRYLGKVAAPRTQPPYYSVCTYLGTSGLSGRWRK